MSQQSPDAELAPAAESVPAAVRTGELTQPGEFIRVLALEDTDGRTDRSLKRPQDWRLGRAEIPVDLFKERVNTFLDSMRTVIARLPQTAGGYELEQVTISAEISAKGQVSLLGSGGEIAGKAGLTFTFTKRVLVEAAPEGAVADH